MSSNAMPPLPMAGPTLARPGRAPLRSLRVLMVLCIVLPLAVFALVATLRYQQIHDETEIRLSRALRIAEEHALKVFDTNELVMARVMDALGNDRPEVIRQREQTLHAQLQAISESKPQIQSIWVQDMLGKPVVGDRFYPVPTDLDVSDRAYFKWHRDKRGGVFISEPLMGKATRTPFFDMSRGRYGTNGDFIGMVSISLSPTYFEKFHSDLVSDEPGLAITMLRKDGVILTRWPPLPDAPPSLSANSPVMSMINAGQTHGKTKGVSSVDGRERLLTFSKVGDYPVYLGTGMDVQQIQSRWLKEMGRISALGFPALIGLLIAAYVAWQRTHDTLRTAQRLNDEIEARGRVEEALLQAQKLEALGRLTGGVAHDFNNALMVISNNIYLLKRKHPAADGPQLESMGRAVQSATKLTRQLLAFSRRQAMVPEYMQLQERLPLLISLLEPVLGSQVKLEVKIEPDTQTIMVDSAEFELALINLAINARDAMPSGGNFTLLARNAGDDLPPLLKGPMVVIEASDTGTGIEASLLNKVFEPFFTTKPVGQGTGLGLSQIYGLCQRAGGIAALQSEPGRGTTVSLYFPAHPDANAAGPSSKPSTDRRLAITVLLVEDNEEVAGALKPVLEAMGCTVTHINRGVLAHDWLQKNAARALPDVLLTDVVMPGEMDGLALAQCAKAKFPGLKIILMTGYSDQLETISRLGFKVIPKPCSADALTEALAGLGTTPPAT